MESGTNEDGTEWERHQATAPRTFEEAITDQNKVPLSQKIANILEKISQLDGGEYDTLLMEIEKIKNEIAGLDLKQWNYHVPNFQEIKFENPDNPDSIGIDAHNNFYLAQNGHQYIRFSGSTNNIEIFKQTSLNGILHMNQTNPIYFGGTEGKAPSYTQNMGVDNIFNFGAWTSASNYINIFECNTKGYCMFSNKVGIQGGRDDANLSSGGLYFGHNPDWGNIHKIVAQVSDGCLYFASDKVSTTGVYRPSARVDLNGVWHFYNNIDAPNMASAAAELLSARQEITEADLQNIELQQTITEHKLDHIVTQQMLTDMELERLEGENGHE